MCTYTILKMMLKCVKRLSFLKTTRILYSVVLPVEKNFNVRKIKDFKLKFEKPQRFVKKKKLN